jgi:MFS family permease
VIVPMAAGIALVVAFALRSVRAEQPLIDVRLFGSRAVTASALTVFTASAAFFGATLLFPLYFQIVRGESALTAGLLLVPFGVGAAATMPTAGKLTDRIGAGAVVLAGLTVTAVALLIFTQVEAGTSYWLLGIGMLLFGAGLGSTTTPAMSAAYQTLVRADVARATTVLNIAMRTGGSIGIALLAVVLQHQLSGARDTAAMADAFGQTFWWAIALIAAAIVAALLLPRRPPAPPA